MRSALRRYFRHGMFPQLMVFEAVARHGSVTRAAEELHLAQPTVSTQLRKLSDALGMPLLELRDRRMVLTAAGRELQGICEELIALLGRLEARLEPSRMLHPAAAAPRVRVAAVSGAGELASELVAALCERTPGLQASLHVGERRQILERMSAGKDDLYLIDR